MKKAILFLLFILSAAALSAQSVEKVYHFRHYQICHLDGFQIISFDQTLPSGLPGEPVLPYQAVSLLLPPGNAATGIEVIGEDPVTLPETYRLYPQQEVRPVSQGPDGKFLIRESVYQLDQAYPASLSGHLLTQFLNGYSLALASFTPVIYNPARGIVTFYRKVTIRIATAPAPSAENALSNLSSRKSVNDQVRKFVQNPEMISQYPVKVPLKSDYNMLIITSSAFETSFESLISHYQANGISCQVVTTQYIESTGSGLDLQEKIRNYIISEYQSNNIEYVLLGGDVEIVPYRGFYCFVESGSGYEDTNIPADLYYSALDGNWNTNGNSWWGEPGEDDLLPDVAVTRFPFSTSAELQNMIHKSVSYQEDPIVSELTRPFMAGEHMYSDPLTFGSDYLELLIGDHGDNGYFTHGIPEAENTIERLYDSLVLPPDSFYMWGTTLLLQKINEGRSFIHHAGHSSIDYMMRLFIWDVTNANFSGVNGIDHNYSLMYSHGCLCGAFDAEDCIAEKAVTIENWLAGGVFNSRYGWFNQGQTEGPSAHLHREFVNALYSDSISAGKLGEAHRISKCRTAPWVTVPGQFEPGAQRWCHYCCNAFGDPAMTIWIDESQAIQPELTVSSSVQLFPNPASDKTTLTFRLAKTGDVSVTLLNTLGQIRLKEVHKFPAAGMQSLTVDLHPLSSGSYLLLVNMPESQASHKLIIQK